MIPRNLVDANLPATSALGDLDLDAEKLEERLAEWEAPAGWTPRAGRRTMREKFTAGMSGLKYAVRGDSSFFAHAYRAILVAFAASLLGVGPMQWIVLIMAASLVLIAELAHSAIDTLARSLGDPEAPGPKIAREIATGGVLIAVVVFAATSIVILIFKMNEMFGWW